MNTINLTLPDEVYRQLEFLAQSEGLTLRQYIVNAMTAHAVSGYSIRATSEQERREQREEFLALLKRLGTDSDEEVDRVLGEREKVEPEPELSAETISKFREMIEEIERSKRAR